MNGIRYDVGRTVNFIDDLGKEKKGIIVERSVIMADTENDDIIYRIRIPGYGGYKCSAQGRYIRGYAISEVEEMDDMYKPGDYVTVRNNTSGGFWTGMIISTERNYADSANNAYKIENDSGKIYNIRQKNIIGLKPLIDIEKFYPKIDEITPPRLMSHLYFDYKKIIFNGPATIIIWKDGYKTISKCSEDDIFDPEKGIAICFMKRAIGERPAKKTLKKEVAEYELNTETISELGKSFCKWLLSGFMTKITISPETKIDPKKEDKE